MAIFAETNLENIVTDLIVVDDVNSPTEQDGIVFCKSLFGNNNYVQTFLDSSKRRKYARIGDYYDLNTDAFYFADITQNNTTPCRWVNLPNQTSYCVNYRTASSLFTGLIASTYFGATHDTTKQTAQNLLDLHISSAPSGTPYSVIRDPIDRFISSYALSTGGVPAWLPVDQFIEWLIKQDKTKLNPHFMPQVNLVGIPEPTGIVYFDFAKDLTPMAVALGLPTPLPSVNVTDPSNKPTLTADQVTTLQNFYSDDMALYAKVQAL